MNLCTCVFREVGFMHLMCKMLTTAALGLIEHTELEKNFGGNGVQFMIMTIAHLNTALDN